MSASAYADYNPLDPAVRENPYPWYTYLRDEAPVKFIESVGAWAVSRHEDVRKLLLDHAQFSSDPLIRIAFGDFNPAPDARYLLSSDPPDHTRLRTLVNKAFSRRYILELRDEIAATAARLLSDLDGRDEYDFIAEFAAPLPVTVVGNILGVEPSMHAAFRRWSNNVTAGGNADALSEQQRAVIRSDANDFREYFLARINAVRKKPEDNLISALVHAEETGQKLSADEVLALSVLLLIAGNETTTNLLSNAMVTLAQFGDEEKLARSERSLIPALIDESLRFQSPVQLLFRRATANTEIAGQKLPQDAIVMPIFASANRDERAFSTPERVDIRRTDLRNQLAFGWGIHLCLGKALANLEGEVALNALFDRYARVEINTPQIEWCDAFYLRGPKNLPVRVHRA